MKKVLAIVAALCLVATNLYAPRGGGHGGGHRGGGRGGHSGRGGHGGHNGHSGRGGHHNGGHHGNHGHNGHHGGYGHGGYYRAGYGNAAFFPGYNAWGWMIAGTFVAATAADAISQSNQSNGDMDMEQD